MTTDPTGPACSHAVLIADDHPIVRRSLINLVRSAPDLRVAGEADGANEAVRLANATSADLVVIELQLRGELTYDAVRLMAERHHVLVFSACDEALCGAGALLAGARGFVS